MATACRFFFTPYPKITLPIDGLSSGTYHVHRKYKLSPMYNKTCTFLHLKTNYTAIPMKGDISDKSVITQPNLNDISLISLTFLKINREF